MLRISFVIPACDEAETISSLVSEIVKLYQPYEVLVVKDVIAMRAFVRQLMRGMCSKAFVDEWLLANARELSDLYDAITRKSPPVSPEYQYIKMLFRESVSLK